MAISPVILKATCWILMLIWDHMIHIILSQY